MTVTWNQLCEEKVLIKQKAGGYLKKIKLESLFGKDLTSSKPMNVFQSNYTLWGFELVGNDSPRNWDCVGNASVVSVLSAVETCRVSEPAATPTLAAMGFKVLLP